MVGGITGSDWKHYSAPFGSLWFDEKRLIIYGTGLAHQVTPLDVEKSKVQAVHVGPATLAVRVVVLGAGGRQMGTEFFPATRRRLVCSLHERGWPVQETPLLHWSNV